MRIRRRLLATVAILSSLVLPGAARADIITYILSGNASGQIGASTFTDALVTLSLTGSTAGVVPFMTVFANTGTATITIAGIGTATINDPMGIVGSPVANPLGSLGDAPFVLFGTLDSPPGIAGGLTGFGGMLSAALLGYDLKTAFAPLTTSPGGVGRPTGLVTHTSRGNLTFASDIDQTNSGTFSAVVTATPEPASLILMFTGGLTLVGIGAGRSRRKA